jgi:hypothetical protein
MKKIQGREGAASRPRCQDHRSRVATRIIPSLSPVTFLQPLRHENRADRRGGVDEAEAALNKRAFIWTKAKGSRKKTPENR